MRILVRQKVWMGVLACLLLLCLQSNAIASENGGLAEAMMHLNNNRDAYLENCAACHGEDGVPMVPGTPDFSKGERLNISDSVLLKAINDGKNVMPPWKEVLNGQQQKDILNYIRVMTGDQTFQKKCRSCHEDALPHLSEVIPKSEKKLRNRKEVWEICKGSDVEKSMNQQENIEVILMLRKLSK